VPPAPGAAVPGEPAPTAATAGAASDLSGAPGGRGGASRGRGRGDRDGGGRGDPCDDLRVSFARRLHEVAPYPRWAQRLHLEGRLRLTFRIGRDGQPRGVRVVSGSGHDGLDRYALDAARRVAGLPAECAGPVVVSVVYRSPALER
jgi:TonB family protein